MRKSAQRTSFGAVCVFALGLLACATGCQLDVAGQTLPSPYWLHDDVQYFAPGPEFILSREAAALKAPQQQQASPYASPYAAPGGMAPPPAPAPGPGMLP